MNEYLYLLRTMLNNYWKRPPFQEFLIVMITD